MIAVIGHSLCDMHCIKALDYLLVNFFFMNTLWSQYYIPSSTAIEK